MIGWRRKSGLAESTARPLVRRQAAVVGLSSMRQKLKQLEQTSTYGFPRNRRTTRARCDAALQQDLLASGGLTGFLRVVRGHQERKADQTASYDSGATPSSPETLENRDRDASRRASSHAMSHAISLGVSPPINSSKWDMLMNRFARAPSLKELNLIRQQSSKHQPSLKRQSSRSSSRAFSKPDSKSLEQDSKQRESCDQKKLQKPRQQASQNVEQSRLSKITPIPARLPPSFASSKKLPPAVDNASEPRTSEGAKGVRAVTDRTECRQSKIREQLSDPKLKHSPHSWTTMLKDGKVFIQRRRKSSAVPPEEQKLESERGVERPPSRWRKIRSTTTVEASAARLAAQPSALPPVSSPDGAASDVPDGASGNEMDPCAPTSCTAVSASDIDPELEA